MSKTTLRKLMKVGGFTDVNSFRAETGLTQDDISDIDVWRVINEDLQEQKRISEVARQKAETARREEFNKRDELSKQLQSTQLRLELEKSRYDPVAVPFRVVTPYETYQQNRMKEELIAALKEELAAAKKARPRRAKSIKRSTSKKPKARRSKSKTKK